MTPAVLSLLRKESEPDLYDLLRENGLSMEAEVYRGKMWKRVEKRTDVDGFSTNRKGGWSKPTKVRKSFPTDCYSPFPYRPGGGLSAALRNGVIARDRGNCALCGFNCLDFMAAINFVKGRIARNALSFDCTFADFLWALGPKAARYPRMPFEIDHIIPRSQDGENVLENLRTLCLKCHRKETNRLIYKSEQQGSGM